VAAAAWVLLAELSAWVRRGRKVSTVGTVLLPRIRLVVAVAGVARTGLTVREPLAVLVALVTMRQVSAVRALALLVTLAVAAVVVRLVGQAVQAAAAAGLRLVQRTRVAAVAVTVRQVQTTVRQAVAAYF